MQAIRTTYLPATNTRGYRVKASAAADSIILQWVDEIDGRTNHRRAAEALRDKLGWIGTGYGTPVSGCLPDGSYCHTFPGRDGIGDI